MNRNRILAVVATLIVLSLMAWQLVVNKKHINDKTKPKEKTAIVISVNADTAKVLPLKMSLEKAGNLLPAHEADIVAAAQGKLVEVNFDLGTNVKEGQVIARIDSRLLELNLEQLELTLEKLKKDSLRLEELYAGDAATETQVTDFKLNYATTKNKADQLRKQISDTHIKAPISGTVTAKNLAEGEIYGSPQMPLGTVVDISTLKVQVQVTEREVYSIATGQDAVITSDIFPGKTFPGKVTYVSPQGDHAHNYLVEITLENDEEHTLKAGTFVYASFQSATDVRALQIPRNALVESIKNPYVYVVEKNVAKRRAIKVGRESGDKIEVTEGLTPGEVVVTTGQINLTDGAGVNIVNNKN